jgi:hypothetical protein
MKLHPLQDRVLIRRVEPEAKTAGGILIPDTAQEKPMEGEVVAVGPGARDEGGCAGARRAGRLPRSGRFCCLGRTHQRPSRCKANRISASGGRGVRGA